MCKHIKQGAIWLHRYHLKVLPKIMWSDVRWGLLQSYLALAFFFIALYFPFQHKAGEPMTIANYFAYAFLALGGLLALYVAFLGFNFMRRGSLKGTLQDNASKQDIVDLGNKIDETNKLLSELIERVSKNDNIKQ